MIICEVIWHAACTHFSVIQLVVDSTMYNTQWNVYFWGGGSWPLHLSSLRRSFAQHTLSCVLDVLGKHLSYYHQRYCGISRPISLTFHVFHTFFTNKWWMSIGVITFTFINCFTLHTCTFIRVFSSRYEMCTAPSSCCMMTRDNLRVPVT